MGEMGEMISLNDLLQYFQEADWPVDDVDESAQRILATAWGRNVILDMEVSLHQEWQLLQVSLHLPELVPSHRLSETLALLNRINSNLPLGHFEIALESRQLGYYVAMPLNGLPYVRENFEALLAWAVDIVDEEHPRLMQVLYAKASAEEAQADGEPERQRRFDA